MPTDDKELNATLKTLLANDHQHDLDLLTITAQNKQLSDDVNELKVSVSKCVTNTEFSPFKNGILAGIGAILLAVLGAVVSLVLRD